MTDTIHSCGPYCDRPECIKRQRDELREQLERVTAERDDWRFKYDEAIKEWVDDFNYRTEGLVERRDDEIKRLRKMLKDANRGAERNAKVNEGLAARVNALTAERDELRRRIRDAPEMYASDSVMDGRYALVRLKDDEL